MRAGRDEFGLDAKDRELLAILSQDASLTIKEIGHRVGLTCPPVHRRIKKLEKAGFIEGYRAIIRNGVIEIPSGA